MEGNEVAIEDRRYQPPSHSRFAEHELDKDDAADYRSGLETDYRNYRIRAFLMAWRVMIDLSRRPFDQAVRM